MINRPIPHPARHLAVALLALGAALSSVGCGKQPEGAQSTAPANLPSTNAPSTSPSTIAAPSGNPGTNPGGSTPPDTAATTPPASAASR